MIIGSISENKDLEKRISITPDIAKKYIASGFQILLEAGYGSHLDISDDEFLKEGCKIEKKENFILGKVVSLFCILAILRIKDSFDLLMFLLVCPAYRRS